MITHKNIMGIVMGKEILRGVGSLEIFNEVLDGKGMRISTDFGKELSKQFAKHSRTAFDHTGDVPYSYRERQVSASVLIAASHFADAVFAEMPTRRGDDRHHSHGWIDCWVAYRNATFILEIKHGYSALKGRGEAQKKLVALWKEANRQLSSVNSNRCDDLRNSKGEIIKSPLLIVTHYLGSRERKNAEASPTHEDICERHMKVAKGLYPSPNWSTLIEFKGDMKGPYSYDMDKRWELYPAVSFYAKFDIVSHNQPYKQP